MFLVGVLIGWSAPAKRESWSMLKRLLAFIGVSVILIAVSEIFFAGKFSAMAIIIFVFATLVWIILRVRSGITGKTVECSEDTKPCINPLQREELESAEEGIPTRSKSVASGFRLDDKGWLVHEESGKREASKDNSSRSNNRKSEKA